MQGKKQIGIMLKEIMRGRSRIKMSVKFPFLLSDIAIFRSEATGTNRSNIGGKNGNFWVLVL